MPKVGDKQRLLAARVHGSSARLDRALDLLDAPTSGQQKQAGRWFIRREALILVKLAAGLWLTTWRIR